MMNDDLMNAMGRRIRPDGRGVAADLLMELGYRRPNYTVNEIATQLEANEPDEAFALCRRLLGDDVTLHYRLIATLLTFSDISSPQKRGGRGIESAVDATEMLAGA